MVGPDLTTTFKMASNIGEVGGMSRKWLFVRVFLLERRDGNRSNHRRSWGGLLPIRGTECKTIIGRLVFWD